MSRNAQAQERNRQKQLSLYEAAQQRETGISRQAHIDQVTAAWKRSDNAKAFVRAIEELGYVLAAGDKRPYVLVESRLLKNAGVLADRMIPSRY